MHGTGAYIAAGESLQVIDTGTGKAMSTVRPRHKPIAEKDGETSAPVLTQDGRQALAPFLVEYPGKGTTPSRAGIELDAVDTTTNKTAWTLDLDDLPSWAGQPSTRARVVATTKSTAVISVGDGEHGATYAVDLDRRKALAHRQAGRGRRHRRHTVITGGLSATAADRRPRASPSAPHHRVTAGRGPLGCPPPAIPRCAG
ncbi:hypothetical protein [Streptomyces sp. C184]|uniref:hypothetical protein n=1 Tax=Streptomyces sp. C184 TaxID=3237121 RepID=UPI0034C66678